MSLQVPLKHGQKLIISQEERAKFFYPDLYRFGAPGEPSLLTSILFCLFKGFQTCELNGDPYSSVDIVRGVLEDLSKKFKKTAYVNLSGGRVNVLSKDGHPGFDYDYLLQNLQSFKLLSPCLLEFLQNIFATQIYFYDYEKCDIFIPYEPDFLYTSQHSSNILIGRLRDPKTGIYHYEFLSVKYSTKDTEEFVTTFRNNHSLIESIRLRIDQKKKNDPKIELKDFSVL